MTIPQVIHQVPSNWEASSLYEAGVVAVTGEKEGSSEYGCKWTYYPYKWPSKWVTRVITPIYKSGLAGGFFNIFFFHPDPWGNDPIWLICFKWVVQPPTRFFKFGNKWNNFKSKTWLKKHGIYNKEDKNEHSKIFVKPVADVFFGRSFRYFGFC